MEYPILAVLSEDERRQVLASARRRRFSRGEVIFHDGDPGDTLHLVAKGHVAIRVTTPLGDVATVRVLKPGDFFGELAVVSPAPRNATACAIDPVETLAVHRDDFEPLRASHTGVERVLVEALATEVRRLAAQLVDALYAPIDKRTWRRLAELSDVFATNAETVLVPLTQEELAQVIGTTRPTLNRLLRDAEADGLLLLSRGRVEILNRDALAKRAR